MEIPDRFLPASGSGHPATHPLFALKTNLLFDVALIPNFEIEIPIGRHWSVNGEYMFPWWLLDGDKTALKSWRADSKYAIGRSYTDNGSDKTY